MSRSNDENISLSQGSRPFRPSNKITQLRLRFYQLSRILTWRIFSIIGSDLDLTHALNASICLVVWTRSVHMTIWKLNPSSRYCNTDLLSSPMLPRNLVDRKFANTGRNTPKVDVEKASPPWWIFWEATAQSREPLRRIPRWQVQPSFDHIHCHTFANDCHDILRSFSHDYHEGRLATLHSTTLGPRNKGRWFSLPARLDASN